MGVFLAAAGTLAFEVLLTRVFSVVMWYSFASMAIAVAMFGLALGGLLPYLFRGPTGGRDPLRDPGGLDDLSRTVPVGLAVLSLLSSLLPYGILLAFARFPLWGGRLLSLFHQPYFEPFRAAGGASAHAGDALQIGSLLFLFSLPFVGAGALFARAFSRRGSEGRTYLEVMSGSAAGVLAYFLAMQAGSGPAAFLFVTALFSLSAAAFSLPPTGRDGPGKFRPVDRSGDPPSGGNRNIPVLGFLALAAVLLAGGILEARYGFAEIRFVRGRYEPDLLWTKWDAASRVAVYPVSGEESVRAWGLSPSYEGPVPRQLGMVVDDTGYTALFGTGSDPASRRAFRSNIASLAYRIVGKGRALIVGPGGGKDILCARSSGDFPVTAVEVNGLVVQAADERYAAFTGRPYSEPGVTAVVAEGRHFIAGSRDRFDVVQMTQVFGRIPPSAGAFTMTEDHLYTTEAFREYLSHLTDRGVLTITRFVYERRVWRILAMAREALRALGAADPAAHVLAFRDRGLVNILVRRTPWPEEELELAERLSRELRFPLMLSPRTTGRDLPGKVLAGTYEGPYDLSAPTDDRPFFYYTLPPKRFLTAALSDGAEFEDRSISMLRGFLAGSFLLCAAFLFLPSLLLVRRDPDRPGSAGALYMFLCGLAYVVLEIVMIRKLTLLFGRPVLSLAAGLSMILLFSAAGGYLAGRPGGRHSPFGLLLATAVVSAYLFLMGEMLSRGAGASLPSRLALAAAYLAPPSMLMGRFFPLGLRLFSGPGSGAAPFYFAANGAAAVLGAAVSQALALNLGYRATTAAGAAVYLGCCLILLAAGRGR